ncbi:MAG: hypothetical protein RSD57_08350 [Comamonas sp.]
MTEAPDAQPLAVRILWALAQASAMHGAETVSLPRLAKMLDASASTVMRELSLLSDAEVAGQAGPGWVQVSAHEGRWMVALTDAGRQMVPCNNTTD